MQTNNNFLFIESLFIMSAVERKENPFDKFKWRNLYVNIYNSFLFFIYFNSRNDQIAKIQKKIKTNYTLKS